MKSYLPVIAIVGRPNVGKSTLFNRLTNTRDALVADFPGLTRDRQYGRGKTDDRSYWVIDTGGIAEPNETPLAALVAAQVEQAIKEADCVLWLVDAQTGLTAPDQDLAKQLRTHQDKLVLVVNKADRLEAHTAASDFYALGLGEPMVIAANKGRGVAKMMESVLARFPNHEPESLEDQSSIRVAVLGRPNVGKSTLINRILGEERVIVSEIPGTTRDSIDIPFERDGQLYTLIDTAGIRRRAKVSEAVEKFSILQSLQAIQHAEIIIQLFDAQEGITEQDLRLTSLILESGRALILVFNKWDGLVEQARAQFKEEVHRRLTQVDFVRRYTVSALHGSGVGQLYHAIIEAHTCIYKAMSTGKLTRVLQKAVEEHSPPRSRGRHIRPRYAHLGSRQPLSIVIHGKQCANLPLSYQRYLTHCYRQAFNLVAVPIQLILRNDENPYKKE